MHMMHMNAMSERSTKYLAEDAHAVQGAGVCVYLRICVLVVSGYK